MLIKTKLAIQDKTREFLAGRSQYIVAVENDWLMQIFHAFEKNILLLLAYLCQD